MKKVSVKIVDQDCFPGLERQAEFFVNVLKKRYDVRIVYSDFENPDLLFFTGYGGENLKWRDCIRIYHTAERDFPNYNLCDYAIGLSDLHFKERFLHFPSYVFYNDILKKCEEQIKIGIDKKKSLNRKFCSTVVSDPFRDPIYFEFIQKLSQYKSISSGGRIGNTLGYRVTDKLQFIKNFKFNIAFENVTSPGYVTEKIIDAFTARTIPIYWGSDWVKKEFGEGGYINVSDFANIKEAIEYIIEVDNDDALYLKILETGPKLIHSYEEWCEILLDYLSDIIENGSRIFNSMRNPNYNEKLIFYKIRNNKISKILRTVIKKYNTKKIFKKKDLGEIYKTY